MRNREIKIASKFVLMLCRLTIMLLCVVSVASAQDRCGSLGRLRNTFRLVEILYPELNDRPIAITLGHGAYGEPPIFKPSAVDAAADFILTIESMPSRKALSTTEQAGAQSKVTVFQKSPLPEELPVHFYLGFYAGNAPEVTLCRPQRLAVSIPSLIKQENTIKEEFRASTPGNDDALTEARRSGLRFANGDEKALLKVLPLKELAEIYAPLRLTRMEFTFPKGRWDSDVLQWRISFKEIGTTRSLNLTVEPLYGKVVDVNEYDPEWEK